MFFLHRLSQQFSSDMNSLREGVLKYMRGLSLQPRCSVSRVLQSWKSTGTFDELDGEKDKVDDKSLDNDKELKPQFVDPQQGGGRFRGVHKAIICGKVGHTPIQKIFKNGWRVTYFSVGTGGMYDQRVGGTDLPLPAQWHRIAVHNEQLGAYAVKQLTKDSAVFIEGDIETRVYYDGINKQVKNIPEICVRRDGKVRLINSEGSASSVASNELRNGLF